MKLFYSVGGGLGHLTRFTAFVNTLQLDEPVTIIASSPFARDSRVIDQRHKILIPPFRAARTRDDLVVWLQQVIDEIKPDQVYIDAFPAGILGELSQVVFSSHTELFLLARIIKWPVYKERIPVFNLSFKKVFRLETLNSEYELFLRDHCLTMQDMTLQRPQINQDFSQIPQDCWLVIHSGPDSELETLLKTVSADLEQQSAKPEVVVIYPGRRPEFVPESFSFYSFYPVFSAYPRAARVYSAAGFNMVEQMRPFRSRHYVMPFDRILDDQFERCRLNQSEFAAVLK